jgi:uncharacterized protein
MSYAVRQFFLNGGNEAWVVRLIGHNTTPDSLTLRNAASAKDVLKVSSLYNGETDRTIDVFVEHGTGNTFSMVFVSTSKTNSADIVAEKFDGPKDSSGNPTGLSMNIANANYVLTQVNDISNLVALEDLVKDNTTLPDATTPNHGTLTSGTISNITSLPNSSEKSFRISLDGASPYTITLPASPAFTDLTNAANVIQSHVQQLRPADPAYQNFTCIVDPGDPNKLVLASGTYGRSSSVKVLAVANDNLASNLHLLTDANPAQLTTAQLHTLTGGAGGAFVSGEEYNLFIGDRSKREGIYALEEVDLFNILCLPGITPDSNSGILTDAGAYCKERRAFLIVDATSGLSADQMYTAMAGQGSTITKTEYGAIYYPWVNIADPLNNGKPRLSPPSGTMAGVYARTDSTRGVWKAPAGTDATLVGVLSAEKVLTDPQNGILNPHGVNCLRVFPVYGPVAWGSRTLRGDDQLTSEYKYIPIRRLALYIEESLYRGTKWAVFEPNDEPLWAQIRLNVGAFMHNLFRQGAFQGATPRQAYLVKCDSETTTQNDIDLGIVNILVAFAPLKPAEFVILQIQQLAGQIQV